MEYSACETIKCHLQNSHIPQCLQLQTEHVTWLTNVVVISIFTAGRAAMLHLLHLGPTTFLVLRKLIPATTSDAVSAHIYTMQ